MSRSEKMGQELDFQAFLSIEDNELIVEGHLLPALNSTNGVVPFIGAGMSVDSGFPGWTSFLKEEAERKGPHS